MNKRAFVKATAEELGCSQIEVSKHFNAIIETLKKELKKGEKISISNFGTFIPKVMGQRNAYSPATGQAIVTESKRVVKFKISPGFLEEIKDV